MALGPSRRNRGEPLNAWPGYVDALSTLLMVIIFVLLVFVLAQGFLSVSLSSRDRALERLNRQVAELAELLSLERGQAEELRGSLGRNQAEARGAAQARDTAQRDLTALRAGQDAAVRERDALRTERDALAARLSDADLAGRGSGERIAALEARLAEALARAEAAGGETALALRDRGASARALAEERAGRERGEAALAGETVRRTEAERNLAVLRAEMEAARRDLAALREEAARLDGQVRADAATIEARLGDLARLSEELRAVAALRDRLEREAAQAMARAEAERDGREGEARAREAAEARAAAAGREAGTAREQAAEYGRLSESARAQAALLEQQMDAMRAELRRVAAALDAQEAAGRDKDAQIAALGTRLNVALAARVEELQRYRSDFFGRLREVLGDRPEVRIVGDRFVFQSEVLFPIGSAELSERGAAEVRSTARTLREIAARIPAEVNWLLRVDGHADRTPFRGAGRLTSNWELSSARAIAVAQLLIGEGLPANRVAAAAFGDNQPLDDRDTPDALARNRRIELRLTDR